MASNTSGIQNTPIPIFKGDSYDIWNIRMRTILMSRLLWDFVGTGYNDADGDRVSLRDNRKKYAKALPLIQSVVHDDIFSRIAGALTSKQAWTLLQNEYQGDSKVQIVKLQGLRREFETIQMKEGWPFADFLSKVMKIVNKIQSYGEVVKDQTVIEKVFRSLLVRWVHVAAATEKYKDLSQLSYDQLMGSFQAHEARVNRGFQVSVEEQALQVREEENTGIVTGY
ncbi:uncharacterized protein LOC143594103 [Bidens hawaiensis]|uniref:uncharacterized protein LOC143594103 n=1 Tax=Bidens hawaiensis TaxID=980011 RepID=UPI00404A4E8E